MLRLVANNRGGDSKLRSLDRVCDSEGRLRLRNLDGVVFVVASVPDRGSDVLRSPLQNSNTASIARTAAVVTAVVMAIAGGALIVWKASHAFLLFLVGVIAAVLLDAAARGLMRLLPLPRHGSLTLVLSIASASLAWVSWSVGTSLADQAREYLTATADLAHQGAAAASRYGLPIESDPAQLMQWLPPPSALFGGAMDAMSAGSSAIVIAFLGAFLAWEPLVYKVAVVSLVPQEKRMRFSEVLDNAAGAMRGWLLGQAVSMVIIFGFTLLSLWLVGMPYAPLLAVIAGVLTFIPTAGPFLAGVAIVLAGLTQSLGMAGYGLVVYAAIQFIETNVVTPVVQEHTVRLPPAFTLASQLILGSLFGLLGFAFAVPLVAAGRVLVGELYVKDQLGGPWDPAGTAS